jgi:hypothetical protein
VRELLVAPAGRLEQAPCPCGLPGPRLTPA